MTVGSRAPRRRVGPALAWFISWALACSGWATEQATSTTHGCSRARELCHQAEGVSDRGVEKALLTEAVGLCPDHARSWNNLGTILEEEGLWEQAYQAFNNAARADRSLSAPNAGLGDSAMALGRFQDAAAHYERFLTLLEEELSRGDPYGLQRFQEEYRRKLAAARHKWQIHEQSIDQVVPSRTLARGFARVSRQEQPSGKAMGPDRLALAILFAFNSDVIDERGRQQLHEMARAMMGADLRESRFLIEGHTDTLGDPGYNLALSKMRAERVRAFLIADGISPRRLSVAYYGASRPLVASGSRDEQALNRRVGFVRLAEPAQ